MTQHPIKLTCQGAVATFSGKKTSQETCDVEAVTTASPERREASAMYFDQTTGTDAT